MHRTWDFGLIEQRLDITLGEYYRERIRIHMEDSYAGVRMRKFPEDLHVYEKLLWDDCVDVVLELGAGHGGSALWFHDRLVTHALYGRAKDPRVIAVDRDISPARDNLAQFDPELVRTIQLVEADIRTPGTPARVAELIPPNSRILIVEDTAHLYETTIAALRGFSGLVHVGGHFVVEDGHRDFPGMLPEDMPSKANGATLAIDEWLRSKEGAAFEIRRDLESYVVTTNPCGWLRRVR